MSLEIGCCFSEKELLFEMAQVFETMMPLIGLDDQRLKIQNFKLNPVGESVYITSYFSDPGILIHEGNRKIPGNFIVFDVNAFFLYAEWLEFFDEDSITILLREISFGELRTVWRVKNKLDDCTLHDIEVIELLRKWGVKEFGDELESQIQGLQEETYLPEEALRNEIDSTIIASLCTEATKNGFSDEDLPKIAEVLTLEKQHLFKNPRDWIAMIFGS